MSETREISMGCGSLFFAVLFLFALWSIEAKIAAATTQLARIAVILEAKK